MPLALAPYLFYPRVYRISELANDISFGRFNEESQQIVKPECLPASLDSLSFKRVYLMDNGQTLWLYIGS